MRHGKALILALLATASLSACATAGGGGAADAEDGVRPRDTAGTRQASIHLVQAGMTEGEEAREEYRDALASALQGIEEMPTNPKAYLIAGQAAVGLRDWVQADTMFDRALELYPGYAEQMEAEREEGWMLAYQVGAEALEEGDLETAEQSFSAADMLFQGRPEARIALGSVYARQGNPEAAAEAYLGALEISEEIPETLDEEGRAAWLQNRQTAALNATDILAQTGDFERAAEVLEAYLEEFGEGLEEEQSRRIRSALAGFYAQSGQTERAEALYEDILGAGDLSAGEYMQAGVGFFNTGEFDRAAESFAAAVELNPYSRDALLNLVQSLYSQAMQLEQEGDPSDDELRSLYQRTLDTAVELRELDPLNRNLVSFMLRSYRALADLSDEARAQQLAQQTQELFREYQDQAYEVADVVVMPQNGQAQISGRFANLSGDAGASVGIRFEILDVSGSVIGSTTVNVQVPEQGGSVEFSETTPLDGSFAGWRYELVD